MSDTVPLLKCFSLSGKTAFCVHNTGVGNSSLEMVERLEDANVLALDVPGSPRHIEAQIKAASENLDANLRHFKGAILLDGSLEGNPLSEEDCVLIQDSLLEAGLKPSKAIYLTQNHDALARHAQFAAGRTDVFQITEYHAFFRWTIKAMARELSTPGWIEQQIDRVENASEGLFLCLNNRLRWPKMVTLGRLARIGAIEKGLVSALSPDPDNGSSGPTSQIRKAFPEDFEAFDQLRERLPLEIPNATRDGGTVLIDPTLYTRTKFSIVTETEATNGIKRRFTEKSIKPLVCGHFCVIVGNVGTLSLLRQWGFKTFDSLFDESYDTLVEPEDRLAAVLNLTETLISRGNESLSGMVRSARPILKHNMEHARDVVPVLLRDQDAVTVNKILEIANLD